MLYACPHELRDQKVEYTRGEFGLSVDPQGKIFGKILGNKRLPLIDGNHLAVAVKFYQNAGGMETTEYVLKVNEVKTHLVQPLHQ